jgi:kynurenine formamidase
MTEAGSLPSYEELAPAGGPPRSTWGMWGERDELGTINLIGPEQVAAAATLVRRGEVFSLNWRVDLPSPAILGRRSPAHEVIVNPSGSLDDRYDDFYPQASSQWDALAHVRHPEWGWYNGFTSAEMPCAGGTALGIHSLARRGLAARFVLCDVAGHRRRRGEPIDCSQRVAVAVGEVDELLREQGAEVRRGDVLLLYFGWTSWYEGLGEPERERLASTGLFPCPGLAAERGTARWLWENGVAAVAADVPALEAMPFDEAAEETFLHHRLIPLLGMAIGEMFDLERLASDCAETGVYEGLFTSAPINKAGGVGSPANAIAIK